MATGMHMDERSVDCLVLGHHGQDRKVSAKSVTMRAMTLCKNLSGYRELLLISNAVENRERAKVVPNFSNQSLQSSKRYYNANKSMEIGS